MVCSKRPKLAPKGWHEHPKIDSVLTAPCPSGLGQPPVQHLLSFSAQTLLQEVSSSAGWVVVSPSCSVVLALCQEPFGVADAIRR